MSPATAGLALVGSGVLVLSHRRVNLLQFPAKAGNRQVAAWITFFILAYLAWPMLVPGGLSLRYVSVLFGLLSLIAGLGFSYCVSFCWNRLGRVPRTLFAGVMAAALLIGTIADYSRFQRIFVRDALQDLSVKMVLDPENPNNAIHTVALPAQQKGAETQDGEAEREAREGDALLRRGEIAEAMMRYEKALALKPDLLATLNNFAWALSTAPDASLRNGAKALQLAEKALRIGDAESPAYLRTVAAAYAENGRFEEAMATAQRASGLARAQENLLLATNIRKDFGRYRRHLPLHPVNGTNARQ